MKKEIRVLVVDDQAGIRCLLAEFLEKQFTNVLTAPDGRETLRIFEQELVDLVLLDVSMPGMDGLTTLRLLRERGYDCPVILMTGWGEHTDVEERAGELGVIGVLTKPFELVELKQLIFATLSLTEEE